MSFIHILDEFTINQIAAGEVVERPSAIVKELIENAMDAGSTAITAEIKEGGLNLIRITDNGSGIAKEDIPSAFLRHATSKIRTAEDLLSVTSLGFRGEALSSIASVAQVEMITKTPTALNGFRYIIEGGEEKSLEEIGSPGGTTIIVRNIFYNTPARRKFLKSAMTETGYISDLMERLIVSHPNVSFKFIVNNQVKLQSSGNNNSKDILYSIYGRNVSRELLSVEYNTEDIKVTGFIGKPMINRGNRNFENYFINGRYIKSNVIMKAIEEAYKPFMMQHKYPFTSLYFEIEPSFLDVNVHPQKMEIRLKNGEEIYQLTYHLIRETLAGNEMIPKIHLSEQQENKAETVSMPEPFEQNRRRQLEAFHELKPQILVSDSSRETGSKQDTYGKSNSEQGFHKVAEKNSDYITATEPFIHSKSPIVETLNVINKGLPYEQPVPSASSPTIITTEQMKLFAEDAITKDASKEDASKEDASKEDIHFLSKKAFEDHRIIGQVFSTYWLVEYKKELYIIDQHAAHEKVLYEKIMKASKSKTFLSQQLLPPIVLTLTLREQEILQKQEGVLISLGYEFEHFGGKDYSVRAVPADLYSISEKELLLEFIDTLAEETLGIPSSTSILERAASLSCKAAVKANHTFSYEEASALIKELLSLENPYHCPHGRPVIISMSQYELERKFKRII